MLSNMKRRIPLNCLKGKYRYHLGEFGGTSFVIFGAEKVLKFMPYQTKVDKYSFNDYW